MSAAIRFVAQYRGHQALVAQLDRASDFDSEGREFESLRARHFGTELGTPKPAVLRFQQRGACAGARFSTHNAPFFLVDFDALDEGSEVIAAVAAVLGPAPGLPSARWRDTVLIRWAKTVRSTVGTGRILRRLLERKGELRFLQGAAKALSSWNTSQPTAAHLAPLSCYRSVGGLVFAEPAQPFARLRSDKNSPASRRRVACRCIAAVMPILWWDKRVS